MDKIGALTAEAPSLAATSIQGPSFTWRGLLYGGLTVGLLDGTEACIFYQAWPSRVFRSVAGVLIGREVALAGGPEILTLGLAMHFTVAFSIVAVYFLLSRGLPALHKYAVPVGMVYGLCALYTMQWVIVPAMRGKPNSQLWPEITNGILGHMFLVGLPAALWARWAYNKRKQAATISVGASAPANR